MIICEIVLPDLSFNISTPVFVEISGPKTYKVFHLLISEVWHINKIIFM